MNTNGNITAISRIRHTLLRIRDAKSLKQAKLEVESGLAAQAVVSQAYHDLSCEVLRLHDRMASAIAIGGPCMASRVLAEALAGGDLSADSTGIAGLARASGR